MKKYVHGLFTTEVEINWTSDCTPLYFVESIRKNFVLTDGTGSYCNNELKADRQLIFTLARIPQGMQKYVDEKCLYCSSF